MKKKDSFDADIYNRSVNAIAHGALTNSKRPECFVKGVYPTHLKRGHGCHVWDTHGNKYIDFICGLGTNLLGYGQEDVTEEYAKTARDGLCLSLGTDIEVKAAEKVKELFPFIEKLRFLKTGSDACSAAIRIARSYTKRDLVVSDGYHGWHDDFVSLTPPASGIPNRLSIQTLKGFTNDQRPAAFIVEPVGLDRSESRKDFLIRLRKTCDDTGALLIFDEIITGFRFPQFSATFEMGVTPDLICLGKGIANGGSVAVVGGKEKIMECDYFVSSTYAGETAPLAAALKTMTLLQTRKFDLEYLWNRGEQFVSKFNSIWKEGVWLEGYATRGVIRAIDDETRALFFQEAAKSGMLFGPSFFFNFPHIEIVDQALSNIRDILTRIKTGAVKLEGEMPVTPYAQKVRSQ